MDVQVFSDPLTALAGSGGLPWDQLASVATYDEELVKPALLLADRVELRTWRLDMQYGERVAATAAMLGVPLSVNIRKVAREAHPGAVDRLAISPELLKDLQTALDLYDHDGEPMPDREFFETEAVASSSSCGRHITGASTWP